MPFPQCPNNTESDYAHLLPDPAVLCLSKLPRRSDPLSREPPHIPWAKVSDRLYQGSSEHRVSLEAGSEINHIRTQPALQYDARRQVPKHSNGLPDHCAWQCCLGS